MSQSTYPFDPTGLSSDNLVVHELHTLTQVNAAPYRMLIPTFAPFYLNNLVIEHTDLQGNTNTLNEGVDYYTALPYMGAMRSTGKLIYGGIPFISNLVQGTIKISYQTVGGEFCCDAAYVYERLLETEYNPRTTWWDRLSNVQQLFPPVQHDSSLDDVYQIEVLFQHLENIRGAILEAPTKVPGSYVAHMLARNPHGLTKEDLGITPIGTMDMVTDQEVVQKATIDNVEKVMTMRQVQLLLRSYSLIP